MDNKHVEQLGEELFALSDKLRASGFLENDEHHAIYERVFAAFSRLAARSPDPAVSETGWLIEHGGHAAPMYWTGKSWGHWSGNHSEACRFSRREDAFRVSLALGDMPNDPPHKIVEHKWMSR